MATQTMGGEMTMGNKFDSALLIATIVALISGAAGGMMVISAQVLRGRSVTLLLWVSYMVVGGVMAVSAFAYRYIMSDAAFVGPEIMLYCIGAGAFTCLALGATHLTARVVIQKFGLPFGLMIDVRPLDTTKAKSGDDDKE